MDWTVLPGSRIDRLPLPLQFPALALRNVVRREPYYVFQNDGLATAHFSPFLHDSEWSALYDEMAADWYQLHRMDTRWRMWILTQAARQAEGLPGTMVEFGVYRGGCAFMILATTDRNPLWLFDTYAGIPASDLSERERQVGLAGRLADTSVDYVRTKLSRWSSRTHFCPGDVFETLQTEETGPISLVHMDLNAAAPTRRALDYAYRRLVSGGLIVFDDYGDSDYLDQRSEIDAFFTELPESILAIPTGQAIVVRQGGSDSKPLPKPQSTVSRARSVRVE